MVLAAYLLFWVAGLAYAVEGGGERRWAGRVGTGALLAAWLVLLLNLVARGLLAGHWPLSTHYEFSLCFVWIVAGEYLLLARLWPAGRGRGAGACVALILLLLSTYAVTVPPAVRALQPLPPVLRSFWLQFHVLSAMVAYGAIGVAAGLALARLFQPRRAKDGAPTWLARWLPPAAELEQMLARLIALGLPWLTLGVLTGAVWAQQAWGRYWGWDPKETWSLISWLWFVLCLHVAPQPRWQARRLAWLTLLGFALILFTFIGVPRLAAALALDTLHGY